MEKAENRKTAQGGDKKIKKVMRQKIKERTRAEPQIVINAQQRIQIR